MAKVRLWLSVRRPGWGATELFTREMNTGFAPREGDRVALLRTEEEPEGSCHHDVRSTYFDWDGTYNVELRQFVLDTELTSMQVRHWAAWWTDRDGDLMAKLVESGWAKY